MFMVCVAYCDYRAAPRPWGNIFLVGCGRRLDLVMKEGYECKGNNPVSMSHAVEGDRMNWLKNPYMNMTASGLFDWHSPHELVLCRLQKTAGGCFRCPTQTVKDETVWSDVITTAYANQLCGLMGSMGFKLSLCQNTDVQYVRAHVSAVKNSTPSYI